jgi:ADP-ribosyl-[dinitrogen reductase] hydrolase
MHTLEQAIAGSLLGTAVGDSLGLPREGLSAQRARALFGSPPLRQAFVAGWGMLSDDTEHTCLVGQALLASGSQPDRFAAALAWRLRGWLCCAPPAIGLATLRACLKLCLGFPPSRSGVWSAGNGPAMRAALLGVCLGHDLPRLREFVRLSTRVTHTDPRAERGALLVALAAAHAARGTRIDAEDFLHTARTTIADADDQMRAWLEKLQTALTRQITPQQFASELGLSRGVSGYIYHTVPVVLHTWLHHQGDFRRTVEGVIELGGDTDSTGAIAGGIAGAGVGPAGIPPEWLRLCDWPLHPAWMNRLAARLAESFGPTARPHSPVPLCWPALPLRNLAFLVILLAHIVRRLGPPWGK